MISGPTSPFPVGTLAVRVPQNHSATFRAMATEVNLHVVDGGQGTPVAMAAAAQVFRDVEAACTRFDPASPLMRANGSPDAWHEVPPLLLAAIREAYEAYVETGGLFDPRVLVTLTSLGSAYRGHSADFQPGSSERDQFVRAAEGAYKRATNANTNYGPAYYNLGLLYLENDPFPGIKDGLQRLNAAKGYFDQYKNGRASTSSSTTTA